MALGRSLPLGTCCLSSPIPFSFPSSNLLLSSFPISPRERERRPSRREEGAAMAGQVSKKELGAVVMQAMLAQKNLRPQRDRLLQLGRRLQQLRPGDDDADRIKKLASDIFKVYFIGIEAGARSIHTCLELAAQNGARFALNPAFATMPDEQLYDTLLTQRLPARPTTQAEAFSRVEAALYAVKLPQVYHLPHCVEHLVGVYPTIVRRAFSAAALTEHLAKADLSDKTPQAAATSSAVDLDKARDFLDRACTIVSLAVKHIDLAVAVLSRFMDPNKVASLSEFTDKRAYISEDGPYPSSDD